MTNLEEVKALAFDVGGTVIDWLTGISSQLEVFGNSKGLKVDWQTFTKRWRTKALEMALNSKREDLPRGSIDGVHRYTLDEVLRELALEGLNDGEKEEIVLFWHRIPPWPDAPKGHARLRKKYTVSTLTILSVPMVIGVSRVAPFYWDCVVSCQMLEWYKFHPSVYRSGAELIGVLPQEVMMVAAHNLDLLAAHKVGFRTALVERPEEWGKGTSPNQIPDHIDEGSAHKEDDSTEGLENFSADVVAGSLEDLADKLGA